MSGWRRRPEDVVIVGAGPVGLATAIELGSRGVSCVVVERLERAGHAPRAKTTHTRTREHLRRWGIADHLAEASPFGVDYPSNVVFVTSLAGYEIARFDNALNCSPERDDRYSEHSQWIPQYKLEAVLFEKASSFDHVEIRYGCEFVSFEQDDDRVTVDVHRTETGDGEQIEARFLVGADGSQSRVRAQIGASMVGTHGLSHNLNMVFRAPGLAEAHQHGPAIMYWQLNAAAPSLVGPMDDDDRWFFMPTGVPAGTSCTEAESLDLIRRSTGIDLPYELLSSDYWVASRLVADKYRSGRVFLAGDACHLHPPFGGFGMNMGIADGVDLGWKMTAVLDGWGGPALLDSYEAERRGAHEFVMDEAEANHALKPSELYRDGMNDPTPEGERIRREIGDLILDRKRAEFHALGVVLGYCYQWSPIVIDDGTVGSWTRSRDYVPSASPGCLAPHAWLEDGRSLYDTFGSGYTLLVLGGDRAGDCDSARREAEPLGIPLDVVVFDDPKLAELYEADLALIRPDQHVAWRGDAWPDSNVMAVVSGRIGSHPR
jgi:2-polyprenyl-6-methoxyphenol hydroxylase-like FAD-dependent oxidoreductase